VADFLADLKLDAVTIAAGLLHDVVEDTLTTIERIRELFGPEVAHVVEGVTKISAITFSSSEERQAENVRKMLAQELTTYAMEKCYVRKDGSLVWANLTVSLAHGPNGEPKYFISVVEEISQRKNAEEGLRRSEARYRDLFENSPISLWEQDFSAVKQRLDTLRKVGVTDFRAYLQARPDLVAELIALVKNVTFNQASLDLYGASSSEDLMVALDRFVPPAAHQLFDAPGRTGQRGGGQEALPGRCEARVGQVRGGPSGADPAHPGREVKANAM
jgi:PAS domain S-box-containing protein